MITATCPGDRLVLLDEREGWPAGTVCVVRMSRPTSALVEILDPEGNTLDLFDVDHFDLGRPRRRPRFTMREPERPFSGDRAGGTRPVPQS
jgi:hypothetical protein